MLFLLGLRCTVAGYAPGRRFGATRRGGVDTDPTASRFEGQAGGERIDAAFGRAIGHTVDATGGDGRNVDDDAAATFKHVGQRGMAAPQCRE
ncbi:hypothetical protein D3C76_1624100 [compost metagenome]